MKKKNKIKGWVEMTGKRELRHTKEGGLHSCSPCLPATPTISQWDPQFPRWPNSSCDVHTCHELVLCIESSSRHRGTAPSHVDYFQYIPSRHQHRRFLVSTINPDIPRLPRNVNNHSHRIDVFTLAWTEDKHASTTKFDWMNKCKRLRLRLV